MRDHLSTLGDVRRQAVVEATDGCWPETREMAAALVWEGRNTLCWKSHRAALMRARQETACWMSPVEFARWRIVAKAIGRRLKREDHPRDDLGITESRYTNLGNVTRWKKGMAAVGKHEAMACGHYALGFEKPCSAEPAELSAWFYPRFGRAAAVAEAMDMTADHLNGMLNGYRIVDGVRHEVRATGAVLRALDWVWRFGPVCPYGLHEPVALWPGQEPMKRAEGWPCE